MVSPRTPGSSSGPCLYIGRKTSHAGLGITKTEWEINLDYTRQALRKHSIGEPEVSEAVAIFQRYKADIVESPAKTK
jgi:hypothetical protein